jgi:hypothetical protein
MTVFSPLSQISALKAESNSELIEKELEIAKREVAELSISLNNTSGKLYTSQVHCMLLECNAEALNKKNGYMRVFCTESSIKFVLMKYRTVSLNMWRSS